MPKCEPTSAPLASTRMPTTSNASEGLTAASDCQTTSWFVPSKATSGSRLYPPDCKVIGVASSTVPEDDTRAPWMPNTGRVVCVNAHDDVQWLHTMSELDAPAL